MKALKQENLNLEGGNFCAAAGVVLAVGVVTGNPGLIIGGLVGGYFGC